MSADRLGRRYLPFYVNPEQWLALCQANGRYGWLAHGPSDAPVGFADIEVTEGRAFLAYYVAPAFRGQGYGKAVAKAALSEARSVGAHEVIAQVSKSNFASLRILRTLGFALEGDVDRDGQLTARLRL